MAWADAFRDQSVLVTGASSGIGRATAVEALRSELHGDPVHVGLVLPGVIDTPMVDAAMQDPGFVALWPPALSMRPSWVVWAIFAAARFPLVEVSVPPGAATIEKLAALAPGLADTVVEWARTTLQWIAGRPRGA